MKRANKMSMDNDASIQSCMKNNRRFLDQIKQIYGARNSDEAKPFVNHFKKRIDETVNEFLAQNFPENGPYQSGDEPSSAPQTLHVDRKRSNVRRKYECYMCKTIASSFNSLRVHMKGDHPLVVRCERCKQEFPFPSALKKHRYLKRRCRILNFRGFGPQLEA